MSIARTVHIFLLLLVAQPVWSQSEPRRYTVGVEDINYYPHYAFGGEQDSYAEALFELFEVHQGIRFELVPMPIHRLNVREDSIVQDLSLPHVYVGFHLSTLKQPAVLAEFDRFLINQAAALASLKTRYGIVDMLAE